MNEIIRKNPRLKVMLRELRPIIGNHLDMAAYDFQLHRLPSCAFLVRAPERIAESFERHIKKSDMLLRLPDRLFFLLLPNTAAAKGRTLFRKILRPFTKEVHDKEVHAVMVEIGPQEIPPEEILERMIIAIHTEPPDPSAIPVDGAKIPLRNL